MVISYIGTLHIDINGNLRGITLRSNRTHEFYAVNRNFKTGKWCIQSAGRSAFGTEYDPPLPHHRNFRTKREAMEYKNTYLKDQPMISPGMTREEEVFIYNLTRVLPEMGRWSRLCILSNMRKIASYLSITTVNSYTTCWSSCRNSVMYLVKSGAPCHEIQMYLREEMMKCQQSPPHNPTK